MAEPRRVEFLFDEKLPRRLARALRDEFGERVRHVLDVLPRGASDEEVLTHAGERGWCLVTRDDGILRRPHERTVLKEFQMGAFFLTRTSDDFCWIVRTVIRHWPEMKRLGAATEKPFLFSVGETRVRPLRRKHLG